MSESEFSAQIVRPEKPLRRAGAGNIFTFEPRSKDSASNFAEKKSLKSRRVSLFLATVFSVLVELEGLFPLQRWFPQPGVDGVVKSPAPDENPDRKTFSFSRSYYRPDIFLWRIPFDVLAAVPPADLAGEVQTSPSDQIASVPLLFRCPGQESFQVDSPPDARAQVRRIFQLRNDFLLSAPLSPVSDHFFTHLFLSANYHPSGQAPPHIPASWEEAALRA